MSHNNVFFLSDYNRDKIAQYFEVREDAVITRAAMKCLYDFKRATLHTHGTPPVSAKAAIEKSIAKIELGYRAFQEYAGQFFRGDAYEENALMVAIICGDYAAELTPRHSGIEKSVLRKAVKIWSNALDIGDTCAPKKHALPFPRESSFLAHIHAFQDMSAYSDEIHGYYIDEIKDEIIAQAIPAWKSCIVPESDIGEDLARYIEYFEEGIEEILRDAEPPRPRPALRLLRPDGPQA